MSNFSSCIEGVTYDSVSADTDAPATKVAIDYRAGREPVHAAMHNVVSFCNEEEPSKESGIETPIQRLPSATSPDLSEAKPAESPPNPQQNHRAGHNDVNQLRHSLAIHIFARAAPAKAAGASDPKRVHEPDLRAFR